MSARSRDLWLEVLTKRISYLRQRHQVGFKRQRPLLDSPGSESFQVQPQGELSSDSKSVSGMVHQRAFV